MSLEDDLSKFERQVNNFSIAGAAGNFHSGFSIGDDARGSGAGAQQARIGPTPEDRIAFLERSFKNFTIRGGHDISVTGSLVAGGFAISAKQAPSGEGTGGGGSPTPTGACCIGASCSVLTAADCVTMGGTYQGDGAPCSPNPCALTGACCADDNTCSITTEADCVGTYQGDDTVCDPNPCCSPCEGFIGFVDSTTHFLTRTFIKEVTCGTGGIVCTETDTQTIDPVTCFTDETDLFSPDGCFADTSGCFGFCTGSLTVDDNTHAHCGDCSDLSMSEGCVYVTLSDPFISCL